MRPANKQIHVRPDERRNKSLQVVKVVACDSSSCSQEEDEEVRLLIGKSARALFPLRENGVISDLKARNSTLAIVSIVVSELQ
jgi:hypothetical protein